MDFHFTPEQEQFRDAVRGFAERHLRDGALKRAHQEEHPWDVAKLMAEQGLMGITMKEEDGGQGGSLMDAIIAIETIASVCPRSADVIQAGNFGPVRVLAEYGTPDQKKRYLDKILAGESVITVGMTEPEAGSAVTDLKTSATPDGEGYRINGVKVFQTHASYADVMLTYVRFGPGVGGIGSVLIPRDAPGFKQGAPAKFLNGEEWVQTYLDNVYVGPENVMTQGKWLQETNRGIQRRTHRQHRTFAGLRPLCLQHRPRMGAAAQAVRTPVVRIPGPAVEIRRHENETRCRPAAAVPGRRERRQRYTVGR